jgi:hypothetical protein
MGVHALLPEKFDDTSLIVFAHTDTMNLLNADKGPRSAEILRLSSMT